MNKKLKFLTQGAIIATLYAVTVFVQNMFPLQTASGAIQVRLAEAFSMLCVLTPTAVPGLTIGCFLANLSAISIMPIDLFVGTFATFISAFGSYKFRNIKWKNIPIISALCPIVFNALLVGGEISLFLTDSSEKGVLVTFLIEFLLIGAGEAISVFLFGIPLAKALEKRHINL